MELCCDVEVDVDGQQLFFVNQKIFSKFSGRLNNLLSKTCSNSRRQTKVIFQDFPGGPNGFELITRFCYNNGIININHYNIILLNHASKYLEMHNDVLKRSNLVEKTEEFLQGMDSWTWYELLLALKFGHRHLKEMDSVSSIQRLVDELVERLASPSMATPSLSSSKCSSFRSSCDSKSTQSTYRCCIRRYWWFEELSSLELELIELVVKRMVLEKFDHFAISKFLFYYQRVKVLGATKIERGKIIQSVTNLVLLLEKRSISIKGLFDTLRIASNLNLRKSCKSQLELFIGSQLDQASLDDLLLPSLKGKHSTKYNVNIVLRFLKNFLVEGNISHKLCSFRFRLKKVARLVDFYASEIAPDDRLKPSKFVTLTTVVPDSARDSHDKIYEAVQIYLEAHPRLSEEQKIKICSTLNYDKLSPRILNEASRNQRFPLAAIVKALVHQYPKLTSSIKNTHYLKFFSSLGCNNSHEAKESLMQKDKVFFKALATNEKLRNHLQEMGWTLIELEKISSQLLQARSISNNHVMMTPKVCCVHNSIKHLPKLCS